MRWHVAVGGYPDGWDTPAFKTDDPLLAIGSYEQIRREHEGELMTTVAIFDDRCGEGEPLDPEQVLDRLEDEKG